MKPSCLLLVAVGPFWAHFGLQGPIFGHFLAVMWPPTAATGELGVQTHGDRVALCNAAFFLGLGSFWGHSGGILGCFGLFGAHFGLMGPILGHF